MYNNLNAVFTKFWFPESYFYYGREIILQISLRLLSYGILKNIQRKSLLSIVLKLFCIILVAKIHTDVIY
jgi:hypothetical protein